MQLDFHAARRWFAYAALVLTAAGCSSVAPYRYIVPDDPGEAHFYTACAFKATVVDDQGHPRPVRMRDQPRAERDDCFAQSVERTDHYTLFFVEFDEQGRFYNPQQLQRLTQYLKRLKANADPARTPDAEKCLRPNDGVSLVTFVHGWRHNARYDDKDVNLARKVLEFTAQGERTGAHYNPANCAREVVGVFVGWRGKSASMSDFPHSGLQRVVAPVWEFLSAFGRKSIAQNVAVGSVRQLFSLLKSYQDQRNEREGGRCMRDDATDAKAQEAFIYQCMPVRHLIVGHSYGALIVQNAVGQHLLENVTRGTFEDPATQCDPGNGKPAGAALVRAYADLIVLLNPAVEGARYEPLHQAVAHRATLKVGEMGAFCPNQKPVMVVLNSEGDWVNHLLFRAVRVFHTLTESNSPYDPRATPAARAYTAYEEGRSTVRAMGHIERYHTHELTSWTKFRDQYGSAAVDAQLDGAAGGLPARVAHATALPPLDREVLSRRRDHARSIAFRCATQPAQAGKERDLYDMFCVQEADRRKKAFEVPQGADVAAADQVGRGDYCRAFLMDLHLSRELPKPAAAGGGRPAGWSSSFVGGTVLTHLPVYRPDPEEMTEQAMLIRASKIEEMVSPHTPVWNIFVRDDSVMGGHGDIEYRALIDLLKQLYRAVLISSFHPQVIETLGSRAERDYDACWKEMQAAQAPQEQAGDPVDALTLQAGLPRGTASAQRGPNGSRP